MTLEVSRYTLSHSHLEHLGPHIPILVRETIGAALLDTGARISLIDTLFAQEQGFRQIDSRTITGVTGTADFPVFDTEIELPWLEITIPSPIQGAPLRANGIPWQAVIGRDILLAFDFRIDGPSGTVSFLKDANAIQ